MSRKFRILITGSAGFVGSHLLNHLRKEGHDVWGIERQNNPDPKIIKADLSDHDRTINEFKDHGSFQIVIHTAAKKQLGRNSQTIRNFSGNNTITANVISLSQRWNPHLIMMSSVSVYGEAGGKNPIKPSDKLEPSNLTFISTFPWSPAEQSPEIEAILRLLIASTPLLTSSLRNIS